MSHACCLTKAEVISQTVTRMSSYITSDTAAHSYRNGGNDDTTAYRTGGNGDTAAYRTGGNGGTAAYRNGGPSFAYLSFMDLILNLDSEFGFRIRFQNPDSESESKFRFLNLDSEFGFRFRIRIRIQNPDSESGSKIRIQNPVPESGFRI
uniref:Uncharacterized protein n=1 Tax=Acrobeloides nanus TaxID=290746 RepID=A0A914ERR5_9BILA